MLLLLLPLLGLPQERADLAVNTHGRSLVNTRGAKTNRNAIQVNGTKETSTSCARASSAKQV